MTDPERGTTVVDNGQQSPKTERREGRPYGQGGPTKSRDTRDQRCFYCGREGHFPEIAIRSSSQGHRDPLDPRSRALTAYGKNPRKVYLEVLVDDEPVDCLQNTGSEVTIIPRSLVHELPKRPIVSQIPAANGTIIEVLGEVDLRVMLEGEEVIIRGVASDHVAEMLLGIDWLEDKGAVWNLRWGELYMKGLAHALKPKSNCGGVQRVVVQESVELPARCETDVPELVIRRNAAQMF